MEIKNYFSNLFKSKTKKLTEQDFQFKKSIEEIVNYSVEDLELFREAFTLKPGIKNHNYQRLEFLGDAVLGSIVSGYIFDNYPEADEGFLTKMKSKIVNRKSLNALGKKLQLTQYLLDAKNDANLSENIDGNLVEAIIGAVYEDVDYDACRDFVLRLLFQDQDIEAFEAKIISYKGLLIEWAQKEKKDLRFKTDENKLVDQLVYFQSSIWIGETKISEAGGRSKKKATEKAAHLAYTYLQNKENNHGERKEISAEL